MMISPIRSLIHALVLAVAWVATPALAESPKTAVVVVSAAGKVKPKFIKVIRKQLNRELKSHGLRPVGPKKLKARVPKPKSKALKNCVESADCTSALREKLGIEHLVFVKIAKRKRKPFDVELRVVGSEKVGDVQQRQVKLPKKLVASVKSLGGDALESFLEPSPEEAAPELEAPVAIEPKAVAEVLPDPKQDKAEVTEQPAVDAVEPAAETQAKEPAADVAEAQGAAIEGELAAEPEAKVTEPEKLIPEAAFVAKPVKQELDAKPLAAREPSAQVEASVEKLEETIDETDASVYVGSVKIEATEDIEKLKGIKTVSGSLTIRASDLVMLHGLGELQTITGDFVVDGCEALTSFRGIGALKAIGRNVVVRGNGSLRSFAGLDSLQTVGGGIRVQGNTALVDINMLKAIKVIGADLDLADNDSLGTLWGLKSVNSVGGYVSVSGNDSLTSLKGLHSLKSVGKDLLIQQNMSLKSLGGMSKLIMVGGHLTVYENEYLQDVTQLDSIKRIRGDVRIDANTSLPACNAESVTKSLKAAAAGNEVVIRGTDMVGKCPEGT